MYPFIMIHTLSERGINNINRGEDGRPKTAVIGTTLRNIASSQNCKFILKEELKRRYDLEIGEQTPMIGRYVSDKLVAGGVELKKAEEHASAVIGTFVDLKKREKVVEKEKENKGKRKKEKDPLKTEIIKIQKTEMDHINSLIEKIIDGYIPNKNDYHFLKKNTAIDIAMTGRMIAKKPEYNVQASLSVNFAFSVNDITNNQQDYFTATDSLKLEGSKGSGHLNYFFYSTGVFYGLYIIDTRLLIENLNGNKELAQKTIRQIIDVLATSSPSANKNRCADGQTWPSYIMIENAEITPRSLCSAFQVPVKGPNITENAIEALEERKACFDACYGKIESIKMNTLKREGNLKKLLDYIQL